MGNMTTGGKQESSAEEDMAEAGGLSSDLPATLLDSLPPELLLHLFSWLDWRSLLALRCVSDHCRDAVHLRLGRLRFFRVDNSLWKEFNAEQKPAMQPLVTGRMSEQSEPAAALTALLSSMVNLRELHVDRPCTDRAQDLLTAVVSASDHWLLLERLELKWYSRVDRDLLRQLCANSIRLTSVTLTGDFSDDDVEAVVTKLPALRTLSVGLVGNACGSFLSQLPIDLHNLTLISISLHSWRITDRLRCRELRSLEILGHMSEPAKLMPVLVGCAHLERLSLKCLDEEFVARLPPEGLPKLRHLTIAECPKDADFSRLVERLPGLESVSLRGCRNVTPNGLALLGSLSSLSVLRLDGPARCVSDWLLTQLSAAPLVELQLPALSLLDEETCARVHIRKTLTVDGVLNLIRHCESLRVLVLSASSRGFSGEERISCGAGVQERDIVQALRLFVDRTAAPVARQAFLQDFIRTRCDRCHQGRIQRRDGGRYTPSLDRTRLLLK